MTSTTPSESHLATLCKKAFLGFWAYPNPHFLDGKRAKECCDLLVVFGKDVLLFSDKHCNFPGGELRLSWRRWYKRAVLSSAKQVTGAIRRLRLGSQLYLDGKCTRALELDLKEPVCFHRILTVRGAREAARKEWGGEGSLMVTGRTLEACLDSPFRLGALNEDSQFSIYSMSRRWMRCWLLSTLRRTF
jgi:hypothetical protein